VSARGAQPRAAVSDRRIGYLFLIFVVLLAIGLIRATWLGAVQAGTLRAAASVEQVRTIDLPAPRGAITDRSGIDLAISESAADVIADPFIIKDPQTTAEELSPLLGRPVLTLLPLLTKPHTGFVYLAKDVPAAAAADALKLQVDGQPINGITTVPVTTRYYPRSWSASQLLGGLYANGHGDSGLEYEYDNVLSGTAGIRRIVNDAIGQAISVTNVKPTRAGKTLQLTLDAPLQDEVEQVLAGVGAAYQPRSATALVMNPNTGAILALANWPRVNANDPAGAPPCAPQATVCADQDHAVSFNYEPGSTFKAITVSGALQDGDITPQTQFDIPPVLQVADRQIHDAESHGYEWKSVAGILQVSSNIGADLIGMRMGAKRFDYWVRRFGFGSPTGVDLPGEQPGLILHSWQYSGSSMGNLPMGQGESVTLMQMAAAYSAIANGGILRPPRLVASIGGKPVPVSSGRRIISPSVAFEVRTMLRGVLADGGTASGAAIPGYDMAGKTGTANEVVDGKYSDTDYAASFIGMVPTDHPQLVVAVLVDRPQGNIYGGTVAAPAFQKIVGWAVPYLGITPR
jgi:cell division protein FtsI (penicillin-binding protein 3)